MLPQNSQARKVSSLENLLPDAHADLDRLLEWICDSAENGTAAHVVERGLFRDMLGLMKKLYQAFFALVGPGDWGETAELDDGRIVKRSQELHTRRLLTVFGEFELARWEGQQSAARRRLPEQFSGSRHSSMPATQMPTHTHSALKHASLSPLCVYSGNRPSVHFLLMRLPSW